MYELQYILGKAKSKMNLKLYEMLNKNGSRNYRLSKLNVNLKKTK